MVAIVYREANEAAGTSCSTEKEFVSTRAARQFIRRNKVQKPSIFIDGRLCVLIGNKYIAVSELNSLCSEALINSDKNQH